MGDINFTSGWTDRLRFQHDSSGIDIDFYDRNSNTHIAGRHLDRAEVRDLVQFLAPSETVTSDGLGTTTERVRVSTMAGFRPGDVHVAAHPGGGVTVDRQVPVKPAEPEFGYGTAYVFGMVSQGVPQERVRGLLSRTGTFTFLNVDGAARVAYQSMFDDFRLED